MKITLRNTYGFTFFEVIVVLVILSIVGAIILGRGGGRDTDIVMQTQILKTHIRHTQSMAMGSQDSNDISGIRFDTNNYWVFKGFDPDTNIVKLFSDEQYATADGKLIWSKMKIAIASPAPPFTVFFDTRGIPYSTYDATTKTPLTNDFPINLKPYHAASPTKNVTITEHTGFIQ